MKRKKQKIGTINQLDLIKHSAGKMNRTMDIVKQGCGIQESKKTYKRCREKRNFSSDYDRGFRVI